MEQWRGTNPLNPNGLTTAEVKQHLTLGREPQAKVAFSNISSSLKLVKVWEINADGGTDSRTYEYRSPIDVSGTALVATFTNLKNSYYVDDDGQKKVISKIERTFSNLKKLPLEKSEVILSVYEDPADGFWYQHSSGVTVKDTYYDEHNNPIHINGNGWLAITSLNAVYGGIHDKQTLSGTPYHVEMVIPTQGGQAYGLAGSSVSVHSDGALYADKSNSAMITVNGSPDKAFTKKGVSTWPDGKQSWDAKGPNEYYGAGLVKITGSSITLDFKLSEHQDLWNPYVWATISTIIPQSPTPEYNVPEKPTIETTTTSYHYNVAWKTIKILQIES